MMAGKPTVACTASASSMLWATAERADSSPMRVIASLNFWRSSAFSMASSRAPIISTPYFCSTPWRARSSAQLSAVCPPMVGSRASGLSFSRMRSSTCQVMGSM